MIYAQNETKHQNKETKTKLLTECNFFRSTHQHFEQIKAYEPLETKKKNIKKNQQKWRKINERNENKNCKLIIFF